MKVCVVSVGFVESTGHRDRYFGRFLQQLPIVTIAFPVMLEKLSGGITFLIFALICLANLLYVWRYVPGTKGKTLEELEKEFAK